jgi:NADH-quinone oxidoreductase subunit C
MGLEDAPGNVSGPANALELLREVFSDGIVEVSTPQGDETAVVLRQALVPVMEFLARDPRFQFDVLMDLTAVDYLGRRPRFDVVYHLVSTSFRRRIRIKVRVEENEPVDSVVAVWKSANWLEREAWDMYGIRFSGHPDLRRILMYEEFQGHPLRKDYPIRKRQPLIGPKN